MGRAHDKTVSAKTEDAATQVSHVAHEAGSEAKSAATSPWFTPLARSGYAAKGVIYLIMGGLALSAALDGGGTPTDQQGAFLTIVERPFGQFLLVVVSIGLVGYALWCLCQGILDVDGKGTSAKGIVARLGYCVVGITYLILAFGAFKLATGGGAGKNSDTSARDFTAQLLAKPLGAVLVIVVGVAALAVAGILYYRAWKVDFESLIQPKELGQKGKDVLVTLGRVGYAALGIVFTEMSLFLVIAALRHNPGDAQGLSGALRQMEQQPFGRPLLALVALGLIAYGIYSVASARYRRVGRA
ncbi:MAG TPA: DUF1206 domain-containing protein [Ktedonobacterales bacterium]|nr:DUF1206 domain-containing protein [Ktedonobacterales bacterium]